MREGGREGAGRARGGRERAEYTVRETFIIIKLGESRKRERERERERETFGAYCVY